MKWSVPILELSIDCEPLP